MAKIRGTHAVLGMDVVSFSKLDNEGQGHAIAQLLAWVKGAIAFAGIKQTDCLWSPAGDGGYLTFKSARACERAVDVAFAVSQHLDNPQENKIGLQMRFAVHAGHVLEAAELGRASNIWGEGINTAARILTISGPSQILVSEEYYDLYIRGKREQRLTCTSPYFRTVKHGVVVQVRNVNRDSLGIDEQQARSQRWAAVRGLWKKTITEYEFLIADAMNSEDPVAALAAAKFLLGLDPNAAAAAQLFEVISHLGGGRGADGADDKPAGAPPSSSSTTIKRAPRKLPYKPQSHLVFSPLPPGALAELMRKAVVRLCDAGETVCAEGDVAHTCFFPISGTVEVVLPTGPAPGEARPTVPPGQIVGEFGLWIPNIRRTATLRATDDCLLLEIGFDAFRNVAARHAGAADAVVGTIKARILQNVLHSPSFFPQVDDDVRNRLAETPFACERRHAGEVLDLTAHVFVLFSGTVRVTPVGGGKPIDLTAPARFGHERAVGIVTPDEPSSLDGTKATVVEDAVLVAVPRAALLDLQGRVDAVNDAWAALWGRRRAEIRRGSHRGTAASASRPFPRAEREENGDVVPHAD